MKFKEVLNQELRLQQFKAVKEIAKNTRQPEPRTYAGSPEEAFERGWRLGWEAGYKAAKEKVLV